MSQASSKALMEAILQHTPLTSKEAAAFVAAIEGAAGLTVPGTHIAAVDAALGVSATGTQIATNVNAIATAVNTLLTELQTAGILAAS